MIRSRLGCWVTLRSGLRIRVRVRLKVVVTVRVICGVIFRVRVGDRVTVRITSTNEAVGVIFSVGLPPPTVRDGDARMVREADPDRDAVGEQLTDGDADAVCVRGCVPEPVAVAEGVHRAVPDGVGVGERDAAGPLSIGQRDG